MESLVYELAATKLTSSFPAAGSVTTGPAMPPSQSVCGAVTAAAIMVRSPELHPMTVARLKQPRLRSSSLETVVIPIVLPMRHYNTGMLLRNNHVEIR
jgi:hypothetical protein